MLPDLILIFILIILNGFFAASEIAVVSAREVRLQTQAEAGNLRAAQALRLRRKPGEFLTTVQVGITLVATLASAVGGIEAARWLAPLITRVPVLEPYSSQIALVLVVLTLSYVSLLLGELVPKRMAIRQPEDWAISVAAVFEFLSRIAAWPVRFLIASADLVMRIWGDESGVDESISPEEIEVLVRRGTAQGILLPVQELMITRSLDFSRQAVRDVMTPRPKIVALEVETPIPAALQVARESGHSRFPVYLGDLDQILGYIHVKDLFWAEPGQRIEELMRQLVFIPEGANLPDVSSQLTQSQLYMGIVLDEFGGTTGLVTLEDIMEVVVGEIEDEYSPVAEVPERGKSGEWSLPGDLPITSLSDLINLKLEPGGVYNTLAGFVMAELGHIPQEGDSLLYQGYRFTVDEMDRLRIKAIRVQQSDAGKESRLTLE
ncbi:MAG: hemolysin family protein [Anaerolineales bacterium]